MAKITLAAIAALTLATRQTSAFAPSSPLRHDPPLTRSQPSVPHPLITQNVIPPFHTDKPTWNTQLFSSTTDDEELLQEIKSMRVGVIKSELESYGINTKKFLEKSELVEALVQARKEGMTPIATATSSSSSSTASTASTSTTSSSTSAVARDLQIAQELSQTSTLRISQLKSELEDIYGINTKKFLEKSELARALAEARVDDRLGGVSGGKKKKKRRSSNGDDDDDEVEEVTAAKVEVITSDNVGPKKKKGARDASSSAGGSPFGGGNPFGGMGGMGGMDMGNIADMLKNMGGGGGGAPGGNPFAGAAGGAGGNPFAGAAGGNPFAGGMPNMGGPGGMDPMKAAQEAMNNPKVRAVMAKAQSNPKVMKAINESMSNPMNMMKYMNDPDVGPILRELQEAMM